MNKDVIYLEPDDDITDIIAKIKAANEKIVALVPPKKAVVLKSAINVKLINKTAKEAAKAVVLITTDEAIVRLAATNRIPVSKNLTTAPAIPEVASIAVEESAEVAEQADGKTIIKEIPVKDYTAADEATDKKGEKEDEPESDQEESKPADQTSSATAKNEKNDANKKTTEKRKKSDSWFQKYRLWLIIGGCTAVALALFIVWAFVLAPSVSITATVHTSSDNFSELINFTEDQTKEDAANGVLYLNLAEIEDTAEVEFEATGTKNNGEKAKGKITIGIYVKHNGTAVVNEGTVFTYNSQNYLADKTTTTYEPSELSKNTCANFNDDNFGSQGCLIYYSIDVTASEPGAKYNIDVATSGWTTTRKNTAISASTKMTGGTDKIVTVVQQSDIDKAQKELEDKISSETEAKNKLEESISKEDLSIPESLTSTVSDIVSTPALGEEVEEGKKAKLSAARTTSVYTVDLVKIEQLIRAKVSLPDDQKIYSFGEPFFDRFLKSATGYTARLKTAYATGPTITEEIILEKVKGKKINAAKSQLNSINGIKVEIETSVPWVTSVPNDANKINIVIKEE